MPGREPVLACIAAVCLLAAPAQVVAQEDDLCLACHADVEAHPESMHGEMGVTCVDCHETLSGVEDFPHDDELAPAGCAGCHADTQEAFEASLHGYALARGSARAPDCARCHGSHAVLPTSDPDSPTHPGRVQGLCAACHGRAGLLTDQIVKLPHSLADYTRSVHGPNNGKDAGAAASCADCHGIHDLRGAGDPASRVHPANVAATCGACHASIRDEYEASIHGRALAAGVSDSPTCIDCHGEHLILSPADPDSSTFAGRLATETCGACHDDPLIIARYGLQAGVVGTYVDSYHGWATRRGYQSSANCVSCHTAHAVLPEAHPDSTIHADNVLGTCRACHEHAGAQFAESYTHEAVSITANPVNRWIRRIYLGIIGVVIGGMLAHNLLILGFHAVRKRKRHAGDDCVRRFDHAQILQHILLATSFIGLAITGFALRFPEAWWVRYLSAIGMNEPVRANLHRIFAVVMVAVAVAHVAYVSLTRRGRRELGAMLPARSDLGELGQNLQYHTGRRKRPAAFGRYDYTQKAEYWALVWGTILMALTGVVLWWPEFAVRLLPAWVVTASQTVHYYEAWLATLSILCWHLFFVVFHPDEYPMSWTWLTGKMSRRTVERHHPRWYAEEIADPPTDDRTKDRSLR